MITKESMRESLAVQEWLEEGREEGRQEGVVREARFALLRCVEGRFPKLNVREAVESISDVGFSIRCSQRPFRRRVPPSCCEQSVSTKDRPD